ncbi:MAG TPA: DoxX family protein [Tepidisphaeraceae bacterium]|jgi:uncharacterized membrane protein YphA (DoxX/SURF4 family)|nr:DoxX family protein [Tepidisphaeraceae bacterium]
MNNPLASLFAMNASLLLARASLGVYFVIAGYNKITGPGIEAFASKSAGLLPSWMPAALGNAYLTALPVVEVLAGAMLVVGFLGRVGAGLCCLMLISIIIALGVWKDPDAMNRPFHANYIMLGLALVLTTVGPGAFSVDRLLFNRKAAPASKK